MASFTSQRTPVTIITGFLGSGKTTLVNHILHNTQGLKFAVIENEFGDVGVDDDLISLANHTRDLDGEQIIEMMNGCICCTVRSDLIRVVKKLLIEEKRRFDGIIIETTGLADPAPVAQTFFVDEDLSEVCELDAILTVVDAKHILQHLDEVKPEGVENEAVEQVAFADRILLNKTDLVSAAFLQTVQRRLHSLNSAAEIICSQHSVVDIHKIINTKCFSLDRILAFEPNFVPGKTIDPVTGQVVVEEEDEHQHDQSVSSIAIVMEDAPVHLMKLQRWIQGLLRTEGQNLFRYKGLLSVQGMENAKYVFQGIHMLFSGRFISLPPEKDTTTSSKFVFIGKHLDKQRLQRGFEACIVRPGNTESLRFTIGTEVEALVGMEDETAGQEQDEEEEEQGVYCLGRIIALWDDGVNPYRIRLYGAPHNDSKWADIEVWGPVDDDALVRLPLRG